MQALSKTAALREASKTVSLWGRGTSWTVCGPYRYSQPTGPCTELQCDSYFKAMRHAASWKACVALFLMGRLTEATSYAVDYAAHGGYDQIGDTKRLLEIGLKAYSAA